MSSAKIEQIVDQRVNNTTEDVEALCFNAFSILYIDTLCYDDQSLRHASNFRLSRGVTYRYSELSVGRSTNALRGGRTGGWTGRGGGRIKEPTGRVSGRTGEQDGQGGDRGSHASNIQGNVRNVNVNHGRGGCSYKDFLACNPKDFDGMCGAIAYTRWIKKMESVQDMSRCGNHQKVKYTAGSLIGKAMTWWNTQVHLWPCSTGRGMVAATKPTTIQSAILKAGVLTNKAIRNGSLRKNTNKR
nr:reverse transcriptase domain-containing protein [Tanacetum cinerariifolium]